MTWNGAPNAKDRQSVVIATETPMENPMADESITVQSSLHCTNVTTRLKYDHQNNGANF